MSKGGTEEAYMASKSWVAGDLSVTVASAKMGQP
jgi:hypothetical protein